MRVQTELMQLSGLQQRRRIDPMSRSSIATSDCSDRSMESDDDELSLLAADSRISHSLILTQPTSLSLHFDSLLTRLQMLVTSRWPAGSAL